MANEKRLIDANDLWQKTFVCEEPGDFRKAIENAPTVDAVEVVHAMWNFDAEWWEYVCSNCRRAIGNAKTYPYCPNCGAKMDGGNDL